MLKRAALISAALLSAGPALAASGDAWAEFAVEVEEGCRAAGSEVISDPSVVVDPFGSESYGLALVSGETGGTPVSMICVFDKQTKAVEIGSELPGMVPATQE